MDTFRILTPAILGGFSNHVAIHSDYTDVLSAPVHNPGQDRSVARNRVPGLTVTVIYEASVGRVTWQRCTMTRYMLCSC
jgi:hypothetical protein